MKNYVFVWLLAILPSFVFGQKIDFEQVKFDYQTLPLSSLNSPARTYSTTIVLSYEAAVAAKKQEWDKYVADETAKAKKEKQDYDNQKLSTAIANKMLGNTQAKPTGVPVLKEPDYIAKLHDKAAANNSAVLPGFAKGDNGEVKLTITLDGFVSGNPTEKVVDPNAPKPGQLAVYSSAPPKPKTVAYEMDVKHVVNFKIENNSGQILFQGVLPGTGDFVKVLTKDFATKAELDNYWAQSRLSFYAAQDDQLFAANMKLLSEYLSNNFGFVNTTRNTSIIVIRDKDVSYEEYMIAFEKAMKGYNLVASPDEKQTVADELNGALEQWKKALAESDINNKKARINAKVTEATYLNCAEAYCWLNNYAEAENCMMKLKTLDLSKYDNKNAELTKFIADQKKRYKANNK